MRLTLKWKVLIVGILLEIVMMVSISGIIYKINDQFLDQVVAEHLREMNSCLSTEFDHHRANLETDVVTKVLQSCQTEYGLTYFVLFDKNEHVVAQQGWPGTQLTKHATIGDVKRLVTELPWTTPTFYKFLPVATSELSYLAYGGTFLYKPFAQSILVNKLLEFSLIILGLSLVFSLLMIRWIRRHLKKLERATNEILEGKYAVTAEHLEMEKTGTVGFAINFVTATLQSRVQALKSSEEHERKTAQRMLKVIDAVPDFMLLSRVSDSYILYANAGVEIMTGESQDKLIGRTLNEVEFGLSKEQRRQMQAALDKKGALTNYETSLHHKNGSQINVLVSASLLEIDGETHCLFICRDITDRKLVEAAVAFANRQLNYVLDAASEIAIISTDVDGVVQMFNHGAEKMLGYRARDQIGKLIPAEIHDQKELSQRRKELSQQLNAEVSANDVLTIIPAKQGSETRNWTYICKSGQRLTVSLTVTRVQESSGKIIGFLGIARDITLQLQAERALQELNTQLEKRVEERTVELEETNKNLAKTMHNLQLAQDELVRSEKLTALGDIVAVVAHEINTPIGNCLTVATTMKERSDEMFKDVEQGTVKRSSLSNFMSDTKEGMDILIRGLHRSSELVNNFKQVAVDQSSDQRRKFKLHEVINEVVALLMPKLRKLQHKLEITIPDNITMDSFPGPIEQIVTNLVNNSILHAFEDSKAGLMKLVATVEEQQVKIVFSDNGKGIPENLLNRIFDPFFTTKMGRGGTGLGLNIVHNITKNMLGGQIEVGSLLGHGTSFVILLPLKAPTTVPAEKRQTTPVV